MDKAHREGGKTGRFLGSGWKEIRRGLFFCRREKKKKERRIKNKQACARNCPSGASSLLLQTPEGFIVDSKPHLRGVLGQAQRERSLIKSRLLMAPMR